MQTQTLTNLHHNSENIDQAIIEAATPDQIRNLNSEGLSVVSGLVNQAIRKKISELFLIPPERISDELICGIPQLISEVESALQKEVSKLAKSPRTVEKSPIKKPKMSSKQKNILTALPDLDKPNLLVITSELGWKTDEKKSEEIALRSARLLKRRVKFLLEFPNGTPPVEWTVIGTLDDPDVQADVKRYNSSVRRKGFRTVRAR